MNLKLSDCHGQCYDRASNMTCSKRGVATQLQSEEPRAVLTHCYGHSQNLAVGDAVKQSKVCQDALDLAYEISKLIHYSPKRNAAFHLIKAEQPAEDEGSSCGIEHSVTYDGLCVVMQSRASWRTTTHCNSCGMTVWTRGWILMSRAESLV